MSSPLSEVTPGSFDSYEGIRILIPGLIAFAAGLTTFMTIAPGQDTSAAQDPLVAVVGSITMGLFLYFWDIPARAAAFSEQQPTNYLEKQYPNVPGYELLTIYFLILNGKMPSNTRNRALYMGSMYRIGTEMILFLGGAASIVLGAALFDYGRMLDDSTRFARIIAAGGLAAMYIFAVMVNQAHERKAAKRSREETVKLWRSFHDDVRRPWALIYVTGIVLICLPNLTVFIERLPFGVLRSAVAAGGAICVGVWLHLYVRGFALDLANPRARRAMHAPTAGLIFTLPLVLSLFIYGPGQANVLSTWAHLVGWVGVAGLVAMSVVIRGHERKLHGVYRGQTRWLKDHPDVVESFLQPNPPSPPTLPVGQPPAPRKPWWRRYGVRLGRRQEVSASRRENAALDA